MTKEEIFDKWMSGEFFSIPTEEDQERAKLSEIACRNYWKRVFAEDEKKTIDGMEQKAQGITSQRIRLEVDEKTAFAYLLRAYEMENKKRGNETIKTKEAMSMLISCAEWLTTGKKTSLLLIGGVGCGKTTTLKAIAQVVRYLTGVAPAYVTALYTYNAVKNGIASELRKSPILLLDDLGTEPTTSKVYGNEMLPIVDILLDRYEKQMSFVITTNKTTEEIRETYGERVADRLTEMCQIANFGNAKTFRK